MGEPIISRYRLMKNKTQDWWISFKNRVYQFPFTEKRSQNAHTAFKNELEEMGHEFPCGTFRPKNRTTFSDIPLVLLFNDPKKSCSFSFLTGISWSFS